MPVLPTDAIDTYHVCSLLIQETGVLLKIFEVDPVELSTENEKFVSSLHKKMQTATHDHALTISAFREETGTTVCDHMKTFSVVEREDIRKIVYAQASIDIESLDRAKSINILSYACILVHRLALKLDEILTMVRENNTETPSTKNSPLSIFNPNIQNINKFEGATNSTIST